jgi:putative membrane-bound dehydrogenase-like protein
MRSIARRVFLAGASGLALFLLLPLAGKEPPRTGPQTEKRFPPLKVPPGFKATLFACDPLIEYPSAIALGPRPGSLFVAVDYMTGLGTDIVRRDEIRLIEDTDGDGYADKATVVASGLNSVQGLCYHGDTLYVMNAPFLSALRPASGGKATERRDLLTGLGLPPEKNPVRLHCANGVVMGHDGWLYLALGDHGCEVLRPEGDRLVLEGGGILRCRPDGHDLHVFATGLRNIYDIALDAELNVFIRDNENDGGEYKIRVCHSFCSADHGYPYLYYERPDEALPPLADLGLGSSAGGVCYLERQFPAEYHGNLFFCEWGRSVVRYRPKRSGSSFAPIKELEFAAGAQNDPYGFKPTDLVVERDGSLIVADWADDQRPKRGRGRIYRIAYTGERAKPREPAAPEAGPERWIAQLDSESSYERIQAQEMLERQGHKGVQALREAMRKGRVGVRARLHWVWVLTHVLGREAVDPLFDLAGSDPDVRVQAQAVRALADLSDPVLIRHRLESGPGDAKVTARLAALARGKDPHVLLEIVIALGRLRWPDAPDWLLKNLTRPDAALAHAAMQTLRRSDNWQAVLRLIDRPSDQPIRALALRACADRFVPAVVDGLIDRLRREPDATRRRELADLLTRVSKKRGQEPYWGYRPPPRPVNTVAWERTGAIEHALDRVLADPDHQVRLAVLRRMQREKIPTQIATLGQWLREEKNPEYIGAILESLRLHPAAAIRTLLESVIAGRTNPDASRLAALSVLVGGLDEQSESRLLHVAESLEDGPVLAEALRQLGRRPRLKAAPLLLNKLDAPQPAVRAAAIEALAVLRVGEAAAPVLRLLHDNDAIVRRAAAEAVGQLGLRTAVVPLLDLARDPDPAVRRASLESLRLLKEPRVVPLARAALADPALQLTALRCIGDLGGPAQSQAVLDVAAQNPSAETLPLVIQMVSRWSAQEPARRPELDRGVADLQGRSGALVRWNAAGPLPAGATPALLARWASPSAKPAQPDDTETRWQTVFAQGTEARVVLGPAAAADVQGLWWAYSDVTMSEQATVQFLTSSSGTLRVWLNGRMVHERNEPRRFQPDAERFDAVLPKGPSRLLVQVAAPKGGVAFHLRFRRKSSRAEHEKLTQAALTQPGDPERGRQAFLNLDKSQCLKCHRLGERGERIGPELTGIGGRFPRIYLIESILEPSRTIATGFQTTSVFLKDGRTLSGIVMSEQDETITLGDNEGRKHVLAKKDIEAQRVQAISTMPEGLEQRLTVDEFVDLIAFLASQKDTRPH